MSAAEVDAYIAGFPEDVGLRLTAIRRTLLAATPAATERMRYGIAAVMLDDTYVLHYAGWKAHIGLYPVPTLTAALEAEVAPFRRATDTVTFLHTRPLPLDLVARIAAEVVSAR